MGGLPVGIYCFQEHIVKIAEALKILVRLSFSHIFHNLRTLMY